MKYHTQVSRVREHDQEILGVASGGASFAQIAHGVCNHAKDAAFPWWLDPTTVGQMASPQLEINIRDHTQVIP